jgi:hypothetical protein
VLQPIFVEVARRFLVVVRGEGSSLERRNKSAPGPSLPILGALTFVAPLVGEGLRERVMPHSAAS